MQKIEKNAAEYIGRQTWDEFKAEADEQTKANPTAWFGQHGETRDMLLRNHYDQAVSQLPPVAAKVPAKPEEKK